MEDETEILELLAKAIRRKNATDAEVARIINRPAERGHAGEYIAAKIFGIHLEPSATCRGIDGCFARGDLAGKTVNIKWYGKQEGILDIILEALPDFYLVMTGPKAPPMSSKGKVRPWLINRVFLFDADKLIERLKARNIKIGIATSMRNELWELAEIYPMQRNSELILSDKEKRLLALFS